MLQDPQVGCHPWQCHHTVSLSWSLPPFTGASNWCYSTQPSRTGFQFSQGLEEKPALLFVLWGTEKVLLVPTLRQEREISPSYTINAVNDFIEMYHYIMTNIRRLWPINTTWEPVSFKIVTVSSTLWVFFFLLNFLALPSRLHHLCELSPVDLWPSPSHFYNNSWRTLM